LPDPGTARVEPSCPHFGACGGCGMQHWRDDAYVAWKINLLLTSLHRAGYTDAVVSEPARTGPNERRRMDLAVRRAGGKVVLGLHRLRSAEVVDLGVCHVLHPDLVALIAPMRALLSRVRAFRREGSVIANLLDSGPDVLIRTDGTLDINDRLALTEFARTHRLPRIAWAQDKDEPEPIAVLRPPATNLSGVSVTPPPGVFLQASASGEAAIIAAVVDALPTKGRIAELFAGCGSITFALVRHARIVAWDGDAASVSALRSAANQAGLSGRLTATCRDLARQPLQGKELSGFAAVVLDPPFAGAAAQVAQIAAARLPVVIYVSCNPATLSRDAKLLYQAGYRLVSAKPIDQFLWSARLESVCVFALP
jgi:23S rRNA (uracil1939-C5)-methyltransferase